MRHDLSGTPEEAATGRAEQLHEQLAVSQLVMEHAADAVFLLNGKGETVYANPAAERMFGWSKAELAGRTLHEAVHDRHPDGRPYPMEECPIGRVFSSGKSLDSHEDTFFHKDGRPVAVACSNAPVLRDGAVEGGVMIVRDISEAKRAQQALAEAEKRQRFRVELGDALRPPVQPADVQSRATRLLCEHLRASRVHYAEIGPDGEHALAPEGSSPAPDCAGRYRLADFPALIAECRAGCSFVSPDLAADPRLSELEKARFASLPASALIAVPLVKEGGLVAMLAVHRDVPQPWSDGEVELVEEAAERIWAGIERARAEAALWESEGRLSFLDRLGAATTSLADADAVLATTTRFLGEHLNLSVCAYADMDEDQDGFTIRGDWAAPGSTSIVGHYSLADFGKLAVTNLGAGLPLVVNDNLRELAPEEAATFQSIGIAATICMPLVKEGRLTALMAIHDRAPRVWTEAELGLLREVTARSWAHVERVAAIAELRSSEARLRELNDTLERQVEERAAALRLYENIVQSDRSPVCAFDKEYRLIAFNRAHSDEFFRIFGHRVQIGENFPELFPPDQADVIRAFMARALAGESYTVVEEFGDPNLAKPYWEVSYYPLRDEADRIVGAFHHAKDISERLRAEAQLSATREALRQSQKMEAMGQLTGGVAHDFNNLLSPIIGSLDMLVRKGIGSERERRLIGGALQSAERAKTLVQRLLAFARRQPLQATAVDLRRIVHGMAELIGSTAGPKIDVRVELPDDLPHAIADSNQVEMAVLNLAVNARDAMPDGGILTISAARASAEASNCSDLAAGDYVRLSVRDNGIGMDQATLERAIEPFFSTKGIGKGTGLGLSMVHGLASQLNGALTISSSPGAGTTVDLWLPISAVAAETGGRASPIDARPSSLGTALLVDDEDLVRMSTADMLAELGYEVVEAGSAEEALRLVGEGLRPDLLITDHLMPGMTGMELAQELRSLRPELPSLIVSGYAEEDGNACTLPRLSKPFKNAELAAQLAKLKPVAQA